MLLDKAEAWCEEKVRKLYRMVWKEGRRDYELEVLGNNPSRFFVFCNINEGEKVFFGLSRRQGVSRGMEDPSHQIEEHWSRYASQTREGTPGD